MTTLLPKDADNNVIPALRLKNGGAHNVASGTTAQRNTTAFDDSTKIISLFATEAVYIKFGESDVVATTNDHYFPAGVYYDIALSGGAGKAAQHNYVSVLQVSTAGNVFISEKE